MIRRATFSIRSQPPSCIGGIVVLHLMIRVHESLDPIIDPYQDSKMVHIMSVSPSAVPRSNEKLVCLERSAFSVVT